MMPPQPPPGQGPVDPRGAFSTPPPPPSGMSQMPPIPPGGAGMYPPPPVMMPPPFYPPPPPQRGSFTRAIFTTLATSIFGLSIALNIYLLFVSGVFSGGTGVHEETIIEGSPDQVIAVAKIEGEINDSTFRNFQRVIKSIEDDAHVKALVLEVNTPGGEVGPSDEIYHRIGVFKEKKHLPVVVSMGAMATSGGYYISCAGDQIVAERTTWTGNIGVIMDRLDLTKLAQKYGVEDTMIYPTTAPYKPMGWPLYPMSDKEHEYLSDLGNDAYSTFRTVVQDGRKGKLKAPMDEVANGKAYTAAQALQLGLIDQIGYAPDAYNAAASLAGVSNKQVVRYEYSPSLLDALSGQQSNLQAPQPSAKVNVNGVNVSLDPRLLRELATPRPMYLWRGE